MSKMLVYKTKHSKSGVEKMSSELIESAPDPVFNPQTGEIYRKTKWASKEDAKEMFPEQ